MNITGLKPCPACRSGELIIYEAHKGGFYVQCENCETRGPRKDDERVAIDAWNALPRHLQWTTETPTKPGLYWCRTRDFSQEVLYLYYDSDGNFRYRPPTLLHNCWLVSDIKDKPGCEWAGPIPEPQEQQR